MIFPIAVSGQIIFRCVNKMNNMGEEVVQKKYIYIYITWRN